MHHKNSTLIINNNSTARQFWRDAFVTLNWDFSETFDGNTGLQEARRLQPELIIVVLPLFDMCWDNLVQQLRQYDETRLTRVLLSPVLVQEAMICNLMSTYQTTTCTMPLVSTNVYWFCRQSLELLKAFLSKATEGNEVLKPSYSNPNSIPVTTERSFIYDTDRKLAKIDGKARPEIKLTKFKLYSFFVDNLNKWVSKDEIERHVYGTRENGLSYDALDKQVERLRKLIEPDGEPYRYLITRQGGYMLQDKPD